MLREGAGVVWVEDGDTQAVLARAGVPRRTVHAAIVANKNDAFRPRIISRRHHFRHRLRPGTVTAPRRVFQILQRLARLATGISQRFAAAQRRSRDRHRTPRRRAEIARAVRGPPAFVVEHRLLPARLFLVGGFPSFVGDEHDGRRGGALHDELCDQACRAGNDVHRFHRDHVSPRHEQARHVEPLRAAPAVAVRLALADELAVEVEREEVVRRDDALGGLDRLSVGELKLRAEVIHATGEILRGGKRHRLAGEPNPPRALESRRWRRLRHGGEATGDEAGEEGCSEYVHAHAGKALPDAGNGRTLQPEQRGRTPAANRPQRISPGWRTSAQSWMPMRGLAKAVASASRGVPSAA